MRQFILASALMVVMVGCSSFRWSDYSSPQVSGRVLDATSRQPLKNATVRRIWGANQASSDDARGAAGLLSRDMVLTDAQGRFRLGAVKDVLTFSSGGIYGVRLSFTHSEYLTVNTNISSTNIFQENPRTAPTIDVGDVFLHQISH